jgi:hypothetical protein
VPESLVTFDKTLFASPSTPEADEAWGNDLTPPGDGFVLIPDPSAYSLPPGQPLDADSSAVGEIYDISVFHQLHCLNHVRTFLLTLKASVEYNTTTETYENLLRSQEDHVWHCFDYVRQALMCHADLTVEWPRTEEDGRRLAVDGWGVAHQCKNWVSLRVLLMVLGRCRMWDVADNICRTLCWNLWASIRSPTHGASEPEPEEAKRSFREENSKKNNERHTCHAQAIQPCASPNQQTSITPPQPQPTHPPPPPSPLPHPSPSSPSPPPP